MSIGAKVASAWQAVAFQAWNTFVLILCLNVGLAIAFGEWDGYRASRSNTIQMRYGGGVAARLLSLYPGMSEREVNDLLNETWGRPLVYETFTGFAEGVSKGRYVNVSQNGYRMGADQGPWPPEKQRHLVIFLFGGSTTFSYGVPDNLALGSQLQQILATVLKRPVAVYNFGRGSYISIQERILFEQLLSAGYVPDMALFLDGINDFIQLSPEPSFIPGRVSLLRARLQAEGDNTRQKAWDLLNSLPLARLVTAMRTRPHRLSGDASARAGDDKELREEYRSLLPSAIDRYFKNKMMIQAVAAAFGVRAVFAWQPTPHYKYDMSHHLFRDGVDGIKRLPHYGYPLMRNAVDERKPQHFVWCADIQKDIREPLYVDALHYSPKMIGMVAECIANGIEGLKVVPAA